MGEQVIIGKIECYGEAQYAVHFVFSESKDEFVSYVHKQALFALLAVAEKDYSETDFK